jgi:hypothetical protein
MRAAILLASALALSACHVSGHTRDARDEGPRGPTVKRNYPVSGFERIKLAGSHDVIVTVGGAPSVSAEGDAASLDRLDVRVEGGQLKVGTKRQDGWFNFDRHGSRVVIHVTVPKLAGASIAGSGDMRIDKVEGNAFDGEIAGSGDMDIASLRVGHADFSIAGSGGITARGNAQSSNVSIAGSGDIDAGGLETRTAKIAVMGSGDVRGNVSESADVSVMGSGDVTMSGAGRCTVHKMGSGDVHCTS